MMPRHTGSQIPTHRIVENLSFCPGSVSTYAAQHMDSISKILNHLLALVVLLDILLFFASFSVAFLPTLGYETFIISLLLTTQAVLVWLILNNHRISIASCLTPTEFNIGLAFGLTIAAVILSFFVVHDFHDTNRLCDPYAKVTTTTNNNNGNRFLQWHNDASLSSSFWHSDDNHLPRALQYETSSSSSSSSSSLGATPSSFWHSDDNHLPRALQYETSSSLDATPAAGDDTAAANATPTGDDTPKQYVSPEQKLTGNLPQDFLLLCDQRRGSMVAVWFWSGLSFWCNFVICLLLWIGHSELAQSTNYENLSMEDYENHFRAAQQQRSNGGGAFVGDYTTVPAVRPDSNLSRTGNNSTASTGYGPSSGGYSDQPQQLA